jgi:deoxyribonuclease V
MTLRELHDWNVSPADAAALQSRFAAQLDTTSPITHWKLVAGADVSFNRYSPMIFAAVIVWDRITNNIVERVSTQQMSQFPYRTGFLSFREAPALLASFAKLRTIPDVVLLDGQGIAHPRRFGLASHVGLWIDRPTIGVAKSRLVGTFAEPGNQIGARSHLRHRGEKVGTVVRTKRNCLPVFVSPGHRVNLATAVKVTLSCLRGYRLPEPTRLAHLCVNEYRRRA